VASITGMAIRCAPWMPSSKTDTPPQKMRAAALLRRTKKILAPVTTWPTGQVPSDQESFGRPLESHSFTSATSS
jgi:hypothetical protein